MLPMLGADGLAPPTGTNPGPDIDEGVGIRGGGKAAGLGASESAGVFNGGVASAGVMGRANAACRADSNACCVCC